MPIENFEEAALSATHEDRPRRADWMEMFLEFLRRPLDLDTGCIDVKKLRRAGAEAVVVLRGKMIPRNRSWPDQARELCMIDLPAPKSFDEILETQNTTGRQVVRK